jgi:hypothetical protein
MQAATPLRPRLFVLAAVTLFLANGVVVAPASAQELNLADRLQILSPPTNFFQLQPCRSKNDPPLAATPQKPGKKNPFADIPGLEVPDLRPIHPDATVKPRAKIDLQKEKEEEEKFTAFYTPPNPNCPTKQPTNVVFNFPINPTYESNVLKSSSSIDNGGSFGFGGGVQITTAGLESRPWDLIAFSATSASARYVGFPAKSVDAVSEQWAYQIFLHAIYYPDHQHPADIYDPAHPPKDQLYIGTMTVDTLSFGVINQTAYTPGLRRETADLFTPQFTLARQNISLFGIGDDPTDNQCWTSNKKAGPGFCHYLDLSLTGGTTFSDVTAQQNLNISAAANLGWRVAGCDWKIALPTVLTARYYENVLGGRQDLLLQVGPTFTYTPPQPPAGQLAYTFSVAMTYNQNYSSLATAAWRGVIVQPTLTLAFAPEISAASK